MLKSTLQFHQSQDNTSCQSFRDQTVVSIRKANREEWFKQRRKKISMGKNSNLGNKILDANLEHALDSYLHQEYTFDMLPQLTGLLKSQDIIDIHKGAIGMRKIALHAENDQIQHILNLQMDQLLLQLLQLDYPHLRFEIVCLLNFITWQIQENDKLYNMGLIDILLKLLPTEPAETIQLINYTLINICSHSLQRKQEILSKGYVEILLRDVLERFDNDKEINEQVCEAIAVMTTNDQESMVREEQAQIGINILQVMLEMDCIENLERLYFCMNAIFNHCRRLKTRQQREKIINKELMGVTVSHLANPNAKFVRRVFKIIGNYIAFIEEAPRAFIAANILQALSDSLSHSYWRNRQQACWVLSNIAIDMSFYILHYHQQGKPSILSKLVTILKEDQESVAIQACVVLANMSYNRGDFQYDEFLEENGVIGCMIDLIREIQSDQAILLILRQLQMIFRTARTYQKQECVSRQMKRNNNIDVIEQLQYRESEEVYELSAKLLKKYFDDKDEPIQQKPL